MNTESASTFGLDGFALVSKQEFEEMCQRIGRYDSWTPDHTIEQWCEEIQGKLTTARDDICKIIEGSTVWYTPTLITLIKEGYMPPQDHLTSEHPWNHLLEGTVHAQAKKLADVEKQRDELAAALRGVIAVADRDTDEFDRARAALAKL